jgi:uncharacterized damage-inducible protein DinB
MTLTQQIGKHFREVYFGENWTEVDLKSALARINWQQAVTKVHNLNSIAALVYHINYYVDPVLKRIQGAPLNASDQFSFNHPPINSEDDWQKLVSKVFSEAEVLALEIEKMNETKLFEPLADTRYGSYYRNLQGIIEHTYYHLGQISLIKKILTETKAD